MSETWKPAIAAKAAEGRALSWGTFTVAGTSTSARLCPDLLRLEQIGEADGLRGRIVRAFFRVLALADRLTEPPRPHLP